MCPRDDSSGSYLGKTAIGGRGRPELRLATWRAVLSALPRTRPRSRHLRRDWEVIFVDG